MRNQILFETFRRKRRLYRRVFDTIEGRAVLADLALWCCATQTTHVPGDPYASAQLEGRRQVYLRLRQGVEMTDAEIAIHAEQAEDQGDE